jgi:Polyketide cyclase / dehydrase and lipid transport
VLKWLLYTLVGLVGLVGLVVVVGLLLPKGHRASRTATYPASPETVFGVIADVEHYPSWRPDAPRVELLADDGPVRRFKEYGPHGAVTYRIEVFEPPARMVTRIADPSLPFGGTWTYELRPTASGGTELTITEDGEVYNPIFRFVSRFFLSQTATIEAYQRALAARLGGRV